MFNMFMASTLSVLESLTRLQSLGVRDEEIQNMAKLIDLGKLGSNISKEQSGDSNNGNTNRWSTF